MGNQNDEVDKIKYYWAYYISCALLLNGGQQFWEIKLKSIYQKLYKDLLLNVRKTLAASLVEVLKLIDMDQGENQEFFIDVLRYYMSDIDEIKCKVIPNLCQVVSLFPKD